MPNFYAHLLYGRQVFEQIAPSLRRVLGAEWDSFCCGCFGPDPLYFYIGGRPSAQLREAGLRLHHGSGRDAMERFRRPVKRNMPYAASFSAGYLLHYILDSGVHPYVRQVTEEGKITHFALEGEFDRYLLLRDGRSYPDAIPEKELPERFYDAAAGMTPELAPDDYRIALKRFRMVSCRMGGWAGTPVRYMVNAASIVPQIKAVRGAVLGKEPRGDALEYMDRMRRLVQEAVPVGVRELERFFDDVDQGRPFSNRLDRDFSGNEVDDYGIH